MGLAQCCSLIKLCAVVKAELFYGVMKSARVDRNLATLQEFVNRFESLPFDDSAAESYARIRLHLERAGTPIGPNDLLIAISGNCQGPFWSHTTRVSSGGCRTSTMRTGKLAFLDRAVQRGTKRINDDLNHWCH
ncbi:type II toxin-antitoxin system VapC family toxin [Candidatus Amarolinea dominans]|uniref:type II toxin-antitoxin system VapC family toxin n=1 Tax=Candidatus Amarolinea dominans TaxID=3140696 RepID=UPI0031CCB93B